MEDGWRNGAVNHRFSSPNESPARLFQISSPANSSASSSPVCSPFSGDGSVAIGVGVGGCNYIEHRVSKFDTLAGVAIKYGVEVADIKKINGLVTDIQMFARKTLYIPLPGRHPPSPIMTNGFDQHGDSSTFHGRGFMFDLHASDGLALRPKASGRTTSGVDNETGPQSSVSTSVGEFSLIDSLDGVKKSSSTPSFQDSDSSSSIWPTVNWSLKPDLQALSTVAISRPIFDGLPKP
ncbi:hypothetical protein AG4045_004992, partial [Apium graveolens]